MVIQTLTDTYNSVELARFQIGPGLDLGAELGGALAVAAFAGSTEIAKLLLDAGADPNVVDAKGV